VEGTGWETESKCEDNIQMDRIEIGRMWTRYIWLRKTFTCRSRKYVFRNRQRLDYLELLNVYQCSIKNIVRGLPGYDLSAGILSGEGFFLDLEIVDDWTDAGTNFGDDNFCYLEWNVSRLSGRHCM